MVVISKLIETEISVGDLRQISGCTVAAGRSGQQPGRPEQLVQSPTTTNGGKCWLRAITSRRGWGWAFSAARAILGQDDDDVE
jgi:hypothetical protein